MSTFVQKLEHAVKHCWISFVVGILFIAIAVIMLLFPIESYETISRVFAVLMFVVGIFEVVFAFSNRKLLPGWGWILSLGILDVVLGVFLIAHPYLSASLIIFILAFWLIFRGFSLIGTSMDLQRFGNQTWGWYLAIGILSIICAIGIIFFPAAGEFTVVYIIAFTFLFLGVARVLLSFDLKKLH
ncbi:MAG: DUF308 domain-containing protein, partial [Dysgonamonadaceae bacterium]|nr:DUF308 domain-containing protein [Dysgonamonadaceae bacterium]